MCVSLSPTAFFYVPNSLNISNQEIGIALCRRVCRVAICVPQFLSGLRKYFVNYLDYNGIDSAETSLPRLSEQVF